MYYYYLFLTLVKRGWEKIKKNTKKFEVESWKH